MKYIFASTIAILAIVAITGKRETRRQYFALAALAFIAALAAFGTYTTTYIRGYKAEPLQVVALQICMMILGALSLRMAIWKKK